MVAAAANYTIRPEDADGEPLIIFIHKHLQSKSENFKFCFIFSEFLALSDPSVLPDL